MTMNYSDLMKEISFPHLQFNIKAKIGFDGEEDGEEPSVRGTVDFTPTVIGARWKEFRRLIGGKKAKINVPLIDPDGEEEDAIDIKLDDIASVYSSALEELYLGKNNNELTREIDTWYGDNSLKIPTHEEIMKINMIFNNLIEKDGGKDKLVENLMAIFNEWLYNEYGLLANQDDEGDDTEDEADSIEEGGDEDV